MQSLKAYVIGRSVSIIYRMMTAFGFGQGDIQNVLSVFASAIYGVFGDALTIPLAVIVWLYDQISNINVALPSWVTWLYDYVTNDVRNNINWLVSSVQDIRSILQGVQSDIGITVNYYVSAAFSIWTDALYYARYIRDNFGSLLINFLSDPFGFIGNVIRQALPAIYPIWLDVMQFFTAVLQPAMGFITHFLSDPAGFVSVIFRSLIDVALMPLHPLLDFLAWWTSTGASFLVQLIADPEKVLLDILAPKFIDWLLGLLAEKW